MRNFMVFLTMFLFATIADAGFQGYAGSTDLKLFNKLQCSTGLTCTRLGDKFKMVSSPTLAGSQTIAGAEAGNATLTLQADESDDNGDDWIMVALASGNSLAFQNDTSGSAVTKLSLSTAGVLTLSDSETITDASDVITFGFDDAAAEVRITAFEATGASLTLQADESDDNGDDWKITNSTANTLTFNNDTSGSQVAKMTISTTGDVTGPGTGALSGYLAKQVASTTTTLTAAQCGSTIISDSADVLALPEASTVLGCEYTFICGTTDDMDINPDNADIIGPVNSVASGTGAAITPSAGDAIRCTDVGSSIKLQAIEADRWAAVGVGNGAWTDVN